MTVLLDERVPRTLDELLRRWARPEHRGTRLEAWLFEDEAARRGAEAALAESGVAARLRSAYKPLVHAFLEEIETDDLKRVEIRYPVRPEADPLRFLSEAYPLAALLDGVETRFEPGDGEPTYRVAVEYRDGRRAEHEVFAPNRLRANHLDEVDLSPSGWVRAAGRPDGAPDLDGPLETEAETVFHRIMAVLMTHPWPAEEPYAQTIAIDVAIPGIERPLPYGDEVMSTREALHEDLYFSLLEFFKRRSGRSHEDRSLRPGQIVPDIRAGDGDAQVRVSLRAYGEPLEDVRPEQEIERAEAAPGLAQIHRELARFPGETFESASCEGRPVRGLYRRGSRPAVLVTSGQHPNETSAPVGSLRAARRLLANPEANLAYVPVENPDGYALHGRLCGANPRHMHHAARYTALGSDVEFGGGEIGARNRALELSGAQLHINLHGYPAHEWTRPFTGYLPRGFELWSIPKGFFLIMRHHPSWAPAARTLIEAVTAGLRAVPGLAEFNRRQIDICAVHLGGTPYEIVNGVPCLITAETRHPTPLTLITEFPDETIYGEAYRFAHTVQMATVVAAEEAFAAIMESAGV
jgi:hypothetical protein